ncbi:hypothetical protein H2203_008068 [Taxawa tesnikishii (nom. ined.)]|nr:hypothetical protein H2203_008068 [Dothideales sp. JES 119]
MSSITTDAHKKLLRATKFPPEFNQKVDTKKIQSAVIKNWASDEVARILSYEDDVVINLLFDMLEPEHPDIKSIQIHLTGFLGNDAATFCKQLWQLCLDAQRNPTGVPQQLVEAKKAEILQDMVNCNAFTRKTGLRKKPANAVKKNGIARGSWIASAIANGETAVMAVVDGEVEVAAAMSVIVPTTQVAQEIALGHVLRGALVDRMTFVEVQRLTVTSQQPATEDVPAPARQQVAHRVARAHLGDVRALETAPSRQTKTGLDATGIPTVEVDGTDVAHLPQTPSRKEHFICLAVSLASTTSQQA